MTGILYCGYLSNCIKAGSFLTCKI